MISREDVETGRTDLHDEGDELLPPDHPGDHVQDWLRDTGTSAYKLAKAMGVPVNRVTSIIEGKRSISADTAIRLGKATGTSAEMWLTLQAAYDLEVARRAGVGSSARHVAA